MTPFPPTIANKSRAGECKAATLLGTAAGSDPNHRTVSAQCLVPMDLAVAQMAGAWCVRATECSSRGRTGRVPCRRHSGVTSPGRMAPEAIMAGMASIELDGPDASACPLLGLAADRRSHFTYPHPGHRCFAKKHPATTDARRQATYCLSLDFTSCDRYRAWKARRSPSAPGTGPKPSGGQIGPVDGPEPRDR